MRKVTLQRLIRLHIQAAYCILRHDRKPWAALRQIGLAARAAVRAVRFSNAAA